MFPNEVNSMSKLLVDVRITSPVPSWLTWAFSLIKFLQVNQPDPPENK